MRSKKYWGQRRRIESATTFSNIKRLIKPCVPRVLRPLLLDLLQKSGYILNAARGPIINKKALMEALDSGYLGGVALDVYWKEPPEPNDPILDYPNVMATPHIAGVSDVSYRGIATKVVENITRVMEGKLPLHCANPNLKARWLRDK